MAYKTASGIRGAVDFQSMATAIDPNNNALFLRRST